MSWFIVAHSCTNCGDDIALCGPFETEKDAEKYDWHYGFGYCATVKIIEAEKPLEKDSEKKD